MIDKWPLPELHILMGIVLVHMNLLIQVFGLDYVEAWTKSMKIIRHGWMGGGYNGNHSKRILDCLDNLAAHLPPSCAPIIDSMRAFKSIVNGNT